MGWGIQPPYGTRIHWYGIEANMSIDAWHAGEWQTTTACIAERQLLSFASAIVRRSTTIHRFLGDVNTVIFVLGIVVNMRCMYNLSMSTGIFFSGNSYLISIYDATFTNCARCIVVKSWKCAWQTPNEENIKRRFPYHRKDSYLTTLLALLKPSKMKLITGKRIPFEGKFA